MANGPRPSKRTLQRVMAALGRSTSAAKLAACKENLALARAARWGRKKP